MGTQWMGTQLVLHVRLRVELLLVFPTQNMFSLHKNLLPDQMIYRAPTTLTKRFEKKSIAQMQGLRQVNCTRCNLDVLETIEHCILDCLASNQIWAWIEMLLG